MKKHLTLLTLLFLTSLIWAQQETITIDFVGVEQIHLHYDQSIFISPPQYISDQSFKDFYYDLEQSNYHTILRNLFTYKQKLHLNDWLYYLLIRQCAQKIFTHEDNNYKTLFTWFILHKSGYQVQLDHIKHQVSISVFSYDNVYDMPKREANGGWFINLTAYEKVSKPRSHFTISSDFNINKKGKPFSFQLKELPTFTRPKYETKKLSFVHDKQLYKVNARINRSIIAILQSYPELSIKEHAQVPLSTPAQASLLGNLKQFIAGKSDYEAIRLLLSFTRQARDYKTDQEAYGRQNVTFTPEETLHYQFSDCEDRSVLFYYLVAQLLDVDIILLDYPEHASVAVALKQGYTKKPIVYKGKKYFICDPTGPGNHLNIGEYPRGLELQACDIIEE